MGSEMCSSYDEVCELLDRLSLDCLTLMEEDIKLKINLEKAMTEGENKLAKCRYIMGPNSVSILNIPLNSESDIEPNVSVESSHNSEENLGISYELITNKTEKSIDPVKWFGFLTPQYLSMAQSSYKNALKWAVEAVNVQNHLTEMFKKLQTLKEIKCNLVET
ncbi:hypothetical protein WA026_005132 [Henosepilachna vigintioctopunctata]|uniref:Vacuolar ATPase assembly protein VMA22 n=1 Tax=Henosepilachna vigintioctopunctata TaxID=420089 RepID=A0AAW1UW35_9CUCU